MPKVSPIQNAFNAGEFSPLMAGRTDYEKYRKGLAVSLNGLACVQGPWTRRTGTYFVAETKDSSKVSRLVRFEYSTEQAYVLEFGDLYMRVFRNRGPVLSGMSPYEVVMPYTEAHVPAINYVQSADVLYLVHPSYKPRKLSRTGHAAWTLTTISLLDGPYLTTNLTTTTLTPAATSGSGVTFTASSIAGINGGAGFRATDVGRHIRIKHSTTWGWGIISAYTDTTHVNVDIQSTLGGTGAVTEWRLGLYNDTDGYPSVVTFHGDRLAFGGSPSAPSRFDMSMVGQYEKFSPSDPDGTVADDHAVAYTLNSKDVQAIRWMAGDEKSLLVGTARGAWVVRPSALGEALSPTNVDAKQPGRYGSAAIQPIEAGKAVLYVTTTGRKLREMAYNIDVDGYKTPDVTVLSGHVTRTGIAGMAFQEEPEPTVWAWRNDGRLLSFGYDRDQDMLAWFPHELGGYADAGQTAPAAVESAVVIPASDGSYHEPWFIVQRYIDGGVVRYVEYMTKPWENGDDQEDAFYVDCGLTYEGAAATTISGLDHLEGETVSVLVNGAAHPDCEVVSGDITLTRSGTKVHAGLGYDSEGQMLRIEAGAADGTAQGKVQRSHRVIFRLLDTLGLSAGPDFDNLDRITFRRSSDLTAQPVPLFTGDKEVSLGSDYSTQNQVCWRCDQPLPCTIVAIMPHMHTQDR